MSQDSLTNGEHDINRNHTNRNDRPSSSTTTTNSKMSSKMSTIKSTTNGKSTRITFHIIFINNSFQAFVHLLLMNILN